MAVDTEWLEWLTADLMCLRKGRGFVYYRVNKAGKFLEAIGNDLLFENLKARFIAIIRSLPDQLIVETLLASYGLLPGYENIPTLKERRDKYGKQAGYGPDMLYELEMAGIGELALRLLTIDYPEAVPPPANTAPDYYRTGKAAVVSLNLADLTLALDSLTNHVRIASLLEDIAKSNECMGNKSFISLFHKTFSRMTNNVYRHRLFKACLLEGYFSANRDELLKEHFHEFTNQIYVYETLAFMYGNGMSDLANRYKDMLTHKKYMQKLGQIASAAST